MSSLTASHLLSMRAPMGATPRHLGLRALFGRMASAVQAANDRQALNGLGDHLLRDIGLSRSDLDAL